MTGPHTARTLAALMAAVGLALTAPTPATAQDHSNKGATAGNGDGDQAQQMPQGMQQTPQGMGQGMMRGQGMMGPQGQGMMRGQGMMSPQGQGMMRGQGMRPGVGMGSGQGLIRGPGAIGYGPQRMMGQRGMAGGVAMTAMELDVAEVRTLMEQRVALTGNPRLAVGNVEQTDAGVIVAEIVTQEENALVNRFAVNPNTGEMWPIM